MANQNWARAERDALCDLLAETGPDAPTLCEGWTTGDLAAHLVLRERRPDAAPGIMVPLLAGRTERVQRRILAETPFPRLVGLLRQGPPAWSPMGLPGVDGVANTVEFFVHHEDVRRARPEWEPRQLSAAFEDLLWRRLSAGRFLLRRVPVQVTLAEPEGRTQRLTKNGKQARVHGLPSELTLWTAGRGRAARVEVTGEAEAVNVLSRSRWRM
ncbi:TIGR03085 family metal-binding protein [Actinoallomurus iriomotensis]|uniref:TIGR03085 family protein n=1 Tax=Actinoallomurus iriomotensis TaxID=478107 RepID=A0A9W6RU51_9ACTN|nr:TIGR03085 family metal-binding protein [Actinoallomurus iriomotensis]GLY82646.1 TIGR03085 family protein [Actinoallomurus iriomotensis]